MARLQPPGSRALRPHGDLAVLGTARKGKGLGPPPHSIDLDHHLYSPGTPCMAQAAGG